MDKIINSILDEYRESFDKGIVPYEENLRIALYRQFGAMEVTDSNMVIFDCSGNVVQSFDLSDDGKSFTRVKSAKV